MALSLDGTTGISASGNITGGNVIASGALIVSSFQPTSVSATGNITGAYILGNGSQLTGVDATQIVNGTSNAKVVSSGGNIAVGIGGTSNVAVFATTGAYVTGLISATGNITGANLIINGSAAAGSGVLIVSGNIQTSTSNATSNIGNASNYFNRLFAQATTALYADLAENYVGDADYTPGTVVDFGGTQEITISTVDSSKRVAGVVSTNPAHLMNAGVVGEHVVTVALIGRVPVSVTGTVCKGDLMVSAGDGTAKAVTIASPKVGTIIGKSLEDFDGDKGTIEIVIGKH